MPKLVQLVNPPTLPRPAGFSHGVEVQGGRTLYLAGQVAVDAQGRVVGADDLVAQFRQVCENLRTLVVARGGQLDDVVMLRIYVRSRDEYKARLKEIGQVYREYFGRHYPAMTLLEVSGLFDDDRGCRLEIDGVAVID